MTRTRNKENLILFCLIVAELCSGFELTMIYTAMPALIGDFADPIAVSWVLTSSLLVAAGVAPLCGRLGDLYGLRRVLIVVLGLTACGSLVSALNPTIEGIILGTAIQGIGGAIAPLCAALVRERLRAERVATGVGIVFAAATGGAAAGLLIGGFMIDHFGWRSIFFLSGGFALFAATLTFLIVPRVSRATTPPATIDFVRGVLFAPAVAGLLLTLSLGQQWGWANNWVIGLLLGSLALLAYWSNHQLRQAHPLINLRLVKDRRVALGLAAMAFLGLGALQHTLVMSLFLRHPAALGGFGLSATFAGLLLMPVRLIGVVFSPISGLVTAKRDGRLALLIGSVLISGGWGVIAVFHASLKLVILGMLLEGAGVAFAYAAICNVILKAVPLERSGEAAGMSSACRALFAGIGAQLCLTILAIPALTTSTAQATIPGFSAVFGFIMVMAGLCMFAAYSLPKRS